MIDTYGNYTQSKIPVYPIQHCIDIFSTQWEISLPNLMKNVWVHYPVGKKNN